MALLLDKDIWIARLVAIVISIVLLGASIDLAVKGWDAVWPTTFDLHNIKIQQAIMWCTWTLFPPVWFLLEFAVFNFDEDRLEWMKYAQDLASKFWIAVAVVLLAVYFGRDLGKEAAISQIKDQARLSKAISDVVSQYQRNTGQNVLEISVRPTTGTPHESTEGFAVEIRAVPHAAK